MANRQNCTAPHCKPADISIPRDSTIPCQVIHPAISSTRTRRSAPSSRQAGPRHLTMDPLTVLGALSGAVQLLDASIKVSSRAYSLISSLKHVKEDMRQLQKTLEETESLMRDLQTYAIEVQRSPSSILYHRILPDSIVQIARQFSEDMQVLRSHLPSDASPSFLRRLDFVLDKKSTREIVQRLEQRKTAASMALDIIGRLNDVKLRDEVLSLQDKVGGLVTYQSALSMRLEQRFEDLAIQTRRSQETQTQIFASQLSAVRSGISSLASHITTETQAVNAMSFSRLLADESPDYLGRIVRAELKQQLEPLSCHLKGVKGMIDQVALAVSEQASPLHAADAARPDAINTSTTHPAQEERVSHHQLEEGRCAESPSTKTRLTRRPREVKLYSFIRCIRTKLCYLQIEVDTYRRCGNFIGEQETFFRLRVLVLPSPWLCSRGLSFMFSSGQNANGHYDICPSIVPFRVIPSSSPVWNAWIYDDISGVKAMLSRHQVTLRDVTEHGDNVLAIAAVFGTAELCQFLVQETGWEAERLLEDIPRSPTVWAGFRRHVDEQALRDILKLFKENTDPSDNAYSTDETVWAGLYYCFRHEILLIPDLIRRAGILLEYGATLQPFRWFGNEDMDKNKLFLDIYLRTGGDPNVVDQSGYPVLLMALFVSANLNDTSACLLTPLIRAGADLYYILDGGNAEAAVTLTDYAFHRGLKDLWIAALEECGLDVDAVFDESGRRLEEHRRLRGATRSGVDVSFIVDQQSSSELSYRGRTRVD
ncbi:hypothetical protein QBC33DRAFT_550042 [Phialemonium atrogriseum]|uniref:Fungal N-terminal domain-containing protein n=1 Tax=Phialemonium atrogriseum TaxID=1093897 RepID=A0AAJ0BUK7_9PEZI|nr:uncharacterized protein QBC33DRAFT_550042 [Phialemonium atrogriseum]KAK1763399.1 hypothetical protein QBC33DRAFT_550042 [Phialemonium atrogriseum]